MYMRVESRTGTFLHLKRNPSIRSWSLLVGIASVGLAAAYYSTDSWAWKLFYVAGCLFVALQNLEDWEEAIFDKKAGKAVLKTYSLYKKVLTLCNGGQEQVVVLIKEIRDVNVEEEKSAVLGGRSDVEAVAKLLTTFLDLDMAGFHSRIQEESSDSEEPLDQDDK